MGVFDRQSIAEDSGALLAWIDEVADAFESHWRRGTSPNLGEYLEPACGERRRALLHELIQIDLEYRWRAGDSRPLSDYARKFPELLDSRGDLPTCLVRRAQSVCNVGAADFQPGSAAFGSASVPVILRCPQCRNTIESKHTEGQDVTCPSCGHSFRLADGEGNSVTFGDDRPTRLDHFELVEVLGRGAFGTVYKARDTRLDRWVAIKLSRRGAFASVDESRRFLREARSAAELTHPNIVPVHAVAHVGATPYIVSEYIDGPTLADALIQRRLGFRETAELIALLAEALAYAHGRKIVHRDINPRNVLIDAEGRPHLTDFGLARDQEASIIVTLDGELLGTPAYMSPEQAAGHASAVDGRSDIYSLGVILYQMLTGELPFRGTVRMLLNQVLHEEPRSPRSFNDRIPIDLETICLKAMAKAPAGRYACAGDFGADLRRYLANEPIRARRASVWERGRKWVRRRPMQAAATLASGVATACLVLALWYSIRIRDMRLVATAEIRAAREVAATQEYFSLVMQVREARARPRAGWTWSGRANLERAATLRTPARNALELRSEAAVCLGTFDLREASVLAKNLQASCLAFSPDGKWLAIGPQRGGAPCSIPIYNLQTRRQELELCYSPGSPNDERTGVRAIAFGVDGRSLVCGTRDGRIHVWELAQSKNSRTDANRRYPPNASWSAHTDEVTGLLFDPDGSALVSCSNDRTVKRWKLARRWVENASLQTSERITTMARWADGRILACGSPSGMKLVEADSLRLISITQRLTQSTENQHVCANADGSVLAVSDEWGVCLIDTRLWRVLRVLREPSLPNAHEDDITQLQFSRDGALLVSAAYDRKIKVWEVASGRLLAATTVLGADNIHPVFSPDGRYLASTGNNRTTLFEISDPSIQIMFGQHPFPVRTFDYAPDGNTIACLAEETAIHGDCPGELAVWDLGTRQVKVRQDVSKGYPRDPRSPSWLTFHPDGGSIAFCCAGVAKRTIYVWDMNSGETRVPSVNRKPVSLSFARHGKTLWTAGNHGNEVASWDVPTLALRSEWSNANSRFGEGRTSVYCVCAGNRWVVAGSWDRSVKLFREYDSELVLEWHCPGGPVFCVALNDDERWFVAGAQNGSAYVVRIPSGELVAELKGHRDGVDSLSFSRDGNLLATGSRDGSVRVWQREGSSLVEVLSLPMSGPVVALHFSPDMTQLAVLLKGELGVRIWNLDILRESLGTMNLAW